MNETLPPLGIQRVKVVALSVSELERANRFYQEKLGLAPAFEGSEQVDSEGNKLWFCSPANTNQAPQA